MSKPASTTMHVTVRWTPEHTSSHVIIVDRTVDISKELNQHLAVIGNGGRFLCYTSTPRTGYTSIEAAITKGSDKRLCLSKLRDIVLEIAKSIDVPSNRVIIELEDRMAPVRLSALCEMIRSTGGDYEAEPETRHQRHNRAVLERRSSQQGHTRSLRTA